MPITTVVASATDLFDTSVRFIVPPYQRRYVWSEEEQWEPLWQDVREIANAILTDSDDRQLEPHFLGALVLYQLQNDVSEPAKREVIDGQQRLLTLQLLIDAAEAVFRFHRVPQAGNLRDLVLNGPNKTKSNPDFRFKIWPTQHDQAAFRATMDDQASADGFKNSRIAQAHKFFHDRIDDWLNETEGDPDSLASRCHALVKAISQRINFVVISVEAGHMATSIFETLNARGTPLLAWDLVKNLVYEKVGNTPDFEDWFDEYLAKFDQDWWQLESGSGRNRRSNIDTLLPHYLVLRTQKEVAGRTSIAVYNDFKKYLDDVQEQRERNTKGIATDLSRIGDSYEAVMSQERSSWFGQCIYRWRISGNGVLTPVILWIYSKLYSDDLHGEQQPQLALAVRALDSYFSRRLVIQASTNDYPELSRGLLGALEDAGPERAGTALLDELIKRSGSVVGMRWPTDEELTRGLVELPLYGRLTVPRVRMILSTIERQMRMDAKFAGDTPLPSDLSIEHVFPRKWQGHWPVLDDHTEAQDETVEQRRIRLINSIGNLTLLTSKLNAKAKNHAWAIKRPLLKEHSKLYLSNDLIDHLDQWDENAITARSEVLARILTGVWPFSDVIRNTTDA